MPIIDMHAHVWPEREALPKRFWDDLLETYSKRLDKPKKEVVESEFFENLSDGRYETLISDMDDAGIDKAVIAPLDYSKSEDFGESEIGIEKVHEYVSEGLNDYPDRLIGFVGVDPRRGEEAIELLEKAVNEWGFEGLKLQPTAGFYLTDQKTQILLRKCGELNIPVLTHLGLDPSPHVGKYGNPEILDEIAVQYPEINFIGAHVARGYEYLACEIAHNKSNIYYDISTVGQYLYKQVPWFFLLWMRFILDRIGKKVFFGSDWPIMKSQLGYIEWVEAIQNLEIPDILLEIPGMKNFSEEEKNMVLGQNAERFLSD